ncbi:MAG: helix-turn-helix domain-containing protein [Chloroflexi bacterium]|nr:helix-turn-helix domain-containing protein [Chloroflexota bacterium]
MDEQGQLLKIPEAAARLRISRSRAYEMAQAGELPGLMRVGKLLRVSARRLDEWVDQASAGRGTPMG